MDSRGGVEDAASSRTLLEAQILAQLDHGDVADAATLAIRGYGPEIFGYLTTVLRSDERAADAFAAFSEALWRGLVGFRRASKVRTWAYKLAVNAARGAIGDASRRRPAQSDTTVATELARRVRSSTTACPRTETRTAIEKLRDELSAAEQTLLILRIDRGLAWEEVAEAVGVEAVTLRRRFAQLKERLRALAKERGIGGR